MNLNMTSLFRLISDIFVKLQPKSSIESQEIFFAKGGLFTTSIGKPVSSRFAQMVSKIQNCSILSRNRVYRLYKSYPFTAKRPQRPETGIKDGFEEMEREFPYRFRTLSGVPLHPEIFRCKCRGPFTFQPDFRKW